MLVSEFVAELQKMNQGAKIVVLTSVDEFESDFTFEEQNNDGNLEVIIEAS